LNWTKTKFFSESGSPMYVNNISYTIEADLAEGDFSNPVTIVITKGLYTDIYTKTLRTLFNNLAGADNKNEQTISIRVKAAGDNLTVYSKPVLLTILPYALSGLTIKPSTINSPTATNFVLQNPGSLNPVLFQANWVEALFYLNGSTTQTSVSSISYKLQIDFAGNQFKSPQLLAETTSLSADIYTKDFNQLLIDKFGANSSGSVDLEMRILIEFTYKGASGNALSENVINLHVTPYTKTDPLQPMYIIGDLNSWNNSDTNGMLIMFKDNQNSNNYAYTYTGYMPVGNYKFLPKESLGSNKAYCFKESGQLQYLETSGNSLNNLTAGYKTININIQNMTYSISDYDIFGATDWNSMGLVGLFNGWTDTEMTRYSNDNRHIWTLDLTLPALTGGNVHPVKFRANSSWTSRWAAIDPESVPFGKSIFLTGTESDPNVVIREGGDYHVVFNDLTGHYIFLKK